MDSHTADVLLAAVAFLSVVAIIKILADHVTMRRITGAHLSDLALQSLLRWVDEAARQGTLKWGLILAAVGSALVAIDLSPISPASAAGVGITIIAGSAGLLAYYALSRRGRGDD